MRDPARILLVDDNAVDRHAVRRALNKAGGRAGTYAAWDAAAARLRARAHDGRPLVPETAERRLNCGRLISTAQRPCVAMMECET